MSLQDLRVTKSIVHPMVGVAFLNFVLLVIMLIMSVTVFANPSGVELNFPSEGQGMLAAEPAVVITVTGENVIYFNGKVVTLNELRRLLSLTDLHDREVMVKVNRRSAMGRVGDILDLCHGIPGVRVNVSTSY